MAHAPARMFPDLLHDGYAMRFGYVYAVFHDVGMQIIGEFLDDEDSTTARHPKHKSGRIIFMTEDGVKAEIVRREQMNLNHEFLAKVLKRWPKKARFRIVKNSEGAELYAGFLGSTMPG